MKKTKILQQLLIAALIPLVLGSCDLFEKRDRTYDDELRVEFKPQSNTVAEGAGNVSTLVQLIGPQQSSGTAVPFVVDTDSSTAVQGTHFTMGTSSPLTIPADSSQAAVTINVSSNSMPDGERRTVVLRLDGSDAVIPASEDLRYYVLTIVGQP